MDYREEYEEALERARQKRDEYIRLDNDNVVSKDIEFIFPELKESEDENIRRELIRFVEENSFEIDAKSTRFITWLEKQGEQKSVGGNKIETEINLVEILKHYPRETELYSPLYGKLWLAKVDERNGVITCYKYPLDRGCVRAIIEQEDTVSFYSNGTTGLPDFNVSEDCMLFLYDTKEQCKQEPIDKAQPKFKVGDWVVVNNREIGLRSLLHIVDFDETQYRVEDVDGNSGCPKIEYLEELYRLWTIQDAKDGDVLVGNYDNCKKPWIGIFKCISKDRPTTQFDSYCFLNSSHHIFTTPSSGKFNQCKGHTIRYALPATKEQRDLLFQKMKEAGYDWDANKKELKKIEQASVWSEEDEKMLISALWHVSYSASNGKSTDYQCEVTDWLKSLKPNHWKPSEEQM